MIRFETPCRMTPMRRFALVFFALILISGAGTRISSAETAGSTWDVVLGANLTHSLRRGYFELQGETQKAYPPVLRFWGFQIGLRNQVSPNVAVQVTGMLDFGESVIDTMPEVPLDNGSIHDIAVTDAYLCLSLVPELQYSLPSQSGFAPFLRMGAGLNYVRVNEGAFINDDAQKGKVQLPDPMEDKTLSIALQGGLGFRLPIPSDKWNLSIAYAYRYWHPVRYDYAKDLPLTSIPYWESFRSHILQIVVGFRVS